MVKFHDSVLFAGVYVGLNALGLYGMGLERRQYEGPLSVIPADGVALATLGLGMIAGSAALGRRARRFAAKARVARRGISDLAEADRQLASTGEQALYFRNWPEKADAIVVASESDCKRLLTELNQSKRSLEKVISKAQAAIQRIRDDGAEKTESFAIGQLNGLIENKSAELATLLADYAAPLQIYIDQEVPALRRTLAEQTALRVRERDIEKKYRTRHQLIEEVLGCDVAVNRDVEATKVRIDAFLAKVYGIEEPVLRASAIAELDRESLFLTPRPESAASELRPTAAFREIAVI